MKWQILQYSLITLLIYIYINIYIIYSIYSVHGSVSGPAVARSESSLRSRTLLTNPGPASEVADAGPRERARSCHPRIATTSTIRRHGINGGLVGCVLRWPSRPVETSRNHAKVED